MKVWQSFLMMGLLSTPLLAQDYYSPTDKEKEPVARFPLPPLEIRTSSAGEKFIEYTLPEALTGARNPIRATEVRLPDDLGGTVQMFVGPKATITCMGSDKNPGCMVTHRNLVMDRSLALSRINHIYFDPQLRSDATVVMDDFQKLAHSGNQPIGVLGALKTRAKDADRPAEGTMLSKYDAPGAKKSVYALIQWNASDPQNLKASYTYSEGPENLQRNPPVGDQGELTNIVFFGNRARGNWKVGSSVGWFEFTFNNARTRFEGYYGIGANGSPRVGRWVSDNVR